MSFRSPVPILLANRNRDRLSLALRTESGVRLCPFEPTEPPPDLEITDTIWREMEVLVQAMRLKAEVVVIDTGPRAIALSTRLLHEYPELLVLAVSEDGVEFEWHRIPEEAERVPLGGLDEMVAMIRERLAD